MKWKLRRDTPAAATGTRVTYYFTVIFTALGTVLAFYYLYQAMDKFTVFHLIVSICGGGIPVGLAGAFLDYRLLKRRIKTEKRPAAESVLIRNWRAVIEKRMTRHPRS